MSVASRNPFALLNDDDVGDDSILTPAATAKPAPAPAPAPAAPAKDQKPRASTRGGRYYQRGGAKNVVKDTPETTEAEPNPKEPRKSEGRGRGGRGGRGRGAGGRGRQFDRHSGTLPDTEKRVNQGWGANEGKAELTAETQGVADAAKDVSGDAAPAEEGWGATAWGAPTIPEGEAAPAVNGETRRTSKDEDDASLTLDEYLAQKAKSEVIPKIESLRKANEGSDEGQWKGAVPLSKDKEDENYFIGKTKSTPKARPKKEEKVHIEIDARFERPSRGGGRGRGDRPRGARGRGGARSNSQTQQPDVNVADQTAFPSLS